MADDIIHLVPRADDADEEEDSASASAMDVSYDTSLPAQHTYLGNDMEDLTGRTVFEEDSLQTIPVLTSHDVILVPGQILPLQIFRPLEISMMHRIIENDRTFGIVGESANSASPQPLGTTAEIRSYKEEVDDLSGVGTLLVKAEGRQRFRIISSRTRSDGILMASIKILPDKPTVDVGEVARLPSLSRFRERTMTRFAPSARHRDPYGFAHMTVWPSWVYRQYDANLLVSKIEAELRDWTENFATLSLPSDPCRFSYWVASSLLLDDKLRLEMLSYNNTVQRLRCELAILRDCRVLTCKECSQKMADRSDVFSMSQSGPQGAYVNPHGYVHEMITVRKATGVYLNGRPSTLYSWFPGYAWTILQCSGCHCHVGWRFTASNKALLPKKFWGLCRAAIRPALQTEGR
uniref:Protein cereblon n=1 Tax=Amblyomma sculptum TaxID=1581419 RepID=A0A1E1XJP7_AMBSC